MEHRRKKLRVLLLTLPALAAPFRVAFAQASSGQAEGTSRTLLVIGAAVIVFLLSSVRPRRKK